MKFSFTDFFSKYDQIPRKLDLVTFTEEILIGKLKFLCNVKEIFPETTKIDFCQKIFSNITG